MAASASVVEEMEPADARSLVKQMVAAGEWPEPALLEQIVAAGDVAVEPLLEILQTRPRGWPEEAPLDRAIGLLSMMRPPQALSPLCDVARFYKNETGEAAGDAIACYGAAGFDALLELIRDRAVSGYQRTHLIDSAKQAGGNDQAQKSRLAELLRALFLRVVEEVKEARQFEEELSNSAREGRANDDQSDGDLHDETIEAFDEEWSDDDEYDGLEEQNQEVNLVDEQGDSWEDDEDLASECEDDACNEIAPTEALSFLASDLADLGDSLARDMVRAAFEEGMIDEWIADWESLERDFRTGGRASYLHPPWLEYYSGSYSEHMSYLERKARSPQVESPDRASYPAFDFSAPSPRPAPVETIRNASPKIGRNDPCWCGSGKKYKKCHLGKDGPE
jgi:hypothetical protein